MKLSEKSISALGSLITGDKGLSRYRKGPELVRFFNEHGYNEIYGKGFPSRWEFAEQKVRGLNGQAKLANVVAAALHPGDYGEEFDIKKAAEYLNQHLQDDGYQVVETRGRYVVRRTDGAAVAIVEKRPDSDPGSQQFIDEQIQKCNRKLGEGDFDGAITNARSLIEAVLRSAERELDPNAADYDGKLPALYGRVQKRLRLAPSKEVVVPLRQILSGLNSVVIGLAGLRNKMSDAHPVTDRPAQHHAKLAVNAAMTLADFIRATMNYQDERRSPPSETGGD